MKTNDISTFRANVATMIDDGRLHDAFKAMRNFSEGMMTWEITTAIDRLEQNYAYMLKYMADGADDPGRDDIRADIAAEARALVDQMARKAFMTEAPTLYYNTARTINAGQSVDAEYFIKSWHDEINRLDNDFDSIGDSTRTRRAEQIARDMFAYLWTAHPLSQQDSDAALKFASSAAHMPSRAMAVGAVGLGAMEFFDERRMLWLLKVYLIGEPEIGLRALVWFLLAVFRYRRRTLPKKVVDALKTAQDSPHWKNDLATATVELLRTRDTERISRQLRDDVFPSLMKLGPQFKDKIKGGSIDIEAMAEGANPEWQEMIERDGIADKLREMSEIQADGGDVYMATFGPMKHFAFFHEIANWFLPFTPNHSEVACADNFEGTIGQVLKRLPFLCDSDKYSLVLSIASAPTEQRAMVAKTLEQGTEQFHDMLSELEKADDNTRRKNIINKFVQDIYRFYNLFRRKGDFFNPFKYNIDLLGIDLLGRDFDDVDTLRLVAEFEVKHQLWEEAVVILKKIDMLSEPDATRAQKIAFCLEQLGKQSEAISYYQQAEMLDGGSHWTLQHLGKLLLKAGEAKQAADIYSRLDAITDTDDTEAQRATAVALGRCYLTLGQHDQAIQAFHKAEYLVPDDMESVAGLARAYMQAGQHERAIADFVRSADYAWTGPVPDGTLGAGHSSWALGRKRDAIDYYIMYMAKTGCDIAALEQAIKADTRALVDAGVDISEMRLLLEAIQYSDNINPSL